MMKEFVYIGTSTSSCANSNLSMDGVRPQPFQFVILVELGVSHFSKLYNPRNKVYKRI